MSEEVKDFTAAPTLSFGAPEPEAPAVQEEKKQEIMDESVLSQEERSIVDNFVSQIDLNNTNGILQYGAGAQKKMADFSEKTLENVRSKDLGEVGDLLAGVVTELRAFDAAEEEKGPFSFFKRSSNKLATMKAKYEKAEVNVNKICDTLEDISVSCSRTSPCWIRCTSRIWLISKNLPCTSWRARKSWNW